MSDQPLNAEVTEEKTSQKDLKLANLEEDKVKEPQEKKKSKIWILYAMGAAICFTLCNAAISEITSKVGPLCIFYFASGGIVTGIVYHLWYSHINLKKGKSFWNDQNLVLQGQVKWRNVVGFTVYCLLYFLIQNLAFLTMFFSALAQVNVGLITTIWSVNPLFMAIMDFIIFKQKLHYYHLVGTISIVICTIVLSLTSVVYPPDPTSTQLVPVPGQAATQVQPFNPSEYFADKVSENQEIMQTWVPVLFGVITPMSFTANGMLTKQLTSERLNFNPSTMSFSAYLIVNLIVLIFAIPYWCIISFSQYLFWVGAIGSIINTIGIVCIQNALATGPAGPASALAAISNLLLIIIEAIKNQKALKELEIVGMVFGTFGAIILVVPEPIIYIFCCKCFRKQKKVQETNRETIPYTGTTINDQAQELK